MQADKIFMVMIFLKSITHSSGETSLSNCSRATEVFEFIDGSAFSTAVFTCCNLSSFLTLSL